MSHVVFTIIVVAMRSVHNMVAIYLACVNVLQMLGIRLPRCGWVVAIKWRLSETVLHSKLKTGISSQGVGRISTILMRTRRQNASNVGMPSKCHTLIARLMIHHHPHIAKQRYSHILVKIISIESD